jgi:hypothetical protein
MLMGNFKFIIGKESFKGLFDFKSFEPMEGFQKSSLAERRQFDMIRQSDIRIMFRLRKYMEKEKELNAKY